LPVIGHEIGLAAMWRQKKGRSATFWPQFIAGNGHRLVPEK
jgi:hypothetical protein